MTVVQINANLPWKCGRTRDGAYLGICDPLKITLVADSIPELQEEIGITLDALLRDVMHDGELDRFLREQGWTAVGAIPNGQVRFNVPFYIEPLEKNGQQAAILK